MGRPHRKPSNPHTAFQFQAQLHLDALVARLQNEPAESVRVTFSPSGLLTFKDALKLGRLPAVAEFYVSHRWGKEGPSFLERGYVVTPKGVYAEGSEEQP